MVTLILGVFLNGLIGLRRDRDGRRWGASQQHLERLRPILKGDAEQFPSIAIALHEKGWLADRSEYRPSQEDLPYGDMWQEQRPLTGDLVNHFRDYAQERADLKNSIKAHDRSVFALVTEMEKGITGLDSDPYTRHRVALAWFKRWMGAEVVVYVRESKGSSSYAFDGESGSGSGRVGQAVIARQRAFETLTPTSEIRAKAAALKIETERIVAAVSELAARVRALSERTALTGTCEYVRIE